MLKIEKIAYNGVGSQRLFYITETKIFHSVKAHTYPSVKGISEFEFKQFEFELWYLDFKFNLPGKYAFIIFEDGLKTLILIVTIKS